MSDRGKTDGFTLLEVMASVVIIGVAMTALMIDRNESVGRVAVTENMRTATMLAQQKMSEIFLGLEAGTSGEFEEYRGFSWRLENTVTQILQEENQSGTLDTVSLIVTYPAGSGEVELKLSAYLRGGGQ